MTCSCKPSSSALELALCLAPPCGEYEVSLEGHAGTQIILCEDGVFIRSVARDEWLPFLETRDRPASRQALLSALKLNNLDEQGLLCLVLRSLRLAANSGSLKAAKKLRDCRELIRRLEEACRGKKE
ncbi:hypothetical protein PYJP_00760 [Pyrofollis japonicus]|uniref:hypothetical protein n=1 Tax=Pyrofollis japonicus TaxID=3060460 RepID=UPI00295BCAE8|nr:hypothetical protein [Pyrofollis japonicus]BEP16724.1 hypothetical protein PYJP_00760 [Pyrofollis japonicus]